MKWKWRVKNNVKYKIIPKKYSKLMKLIGFLIYPFNKTFMNGYTTTIGHTIYTSSPDGYISNTTLAHELVHVKQYEEYGLWFSLSYLLFLPAFWTYRAKWEMEASEVSIRMLYKSNPLYVKTTYRQKMIKRFTGPDYLYMCINKDKVISWFDGIIKDIEQNRK